MKRFAQAIYAAGAAMFAFGYVAAWPRLPAQIPSHVGGDGVVDAWLGRGTYFVVALVAIAVTGLCWGRVRRSADGDATDLGWLLVALSEMGLLAALPIHGATGEARWLTVVTGCAIVMAAAVITLVVASIAAGAGTFRRARMVSFAVEIHRSSRRAAWNLLFLAGPAIAFAATPNLGVRLVAAAGFGLGVWAIALLGRGFQYRFGSAGVEVTALGGRVLFVPRDEIIGCEARSVDPLRTFGGWGIRGTGTQRAFILGGHDGVSITTRQGEVFLGHPDPARLLRHLERVRHGGAS